MTKEGEPGCQALGGRPRLRLCAQPPVEREKRERETAAPAATAPPRLFHLQEPRMPWLRGAETTAEVSLAPRPKGRSEVGPGWGNRLEQHRPSAFPTYAGAGVKCMGCNFFLPPSFIFPLNKGEPGRGLKSSCVFLHTLHARAL